MSGKRVLKRVWEDIKNDDFNEKIENEKDFVYDEIIEAMENKQTHYSIPTSVIHWKEIREWLETEHELTCCIKSVNGGYNPSTHDYFEIISLYVTW